MRRTKTPKSALNRIAKGDGQLSGYEAQQVMDAYTSVIKARASLASKMGSQYGGQRNLYDALGYEQELEYDDYVKKYERHDIARAIIDRPVNTTWKDGFSIKEPEVDKETSLEKEFKKLNREIGIVDKLKRLDKVTGLGQYGVLLMGLSDVKNARQLETKVTPSSSLRLGYLKPFGEGNAEIIDWEDDASSDRFGKPSMYRLRIYSPNENTYTTKKVHESRIIHTVDDLLESDINSTPRLKPIYNRLEDLQKLVGASAEMFWRGARPGYQGKVDDEYTLGSGAKEELKEQINEYEHDLRRIIVNRGIDLQSLSSQIEDPMNHVKVQLQMISAVTGIPIRVLVGTEQGKLASSEDKNRWLEHISGRRNNHATNHIVRPFIDTCIEYGILPEPESDDYVVDWPDLWAPSDQEQAEIGNTRAKALANYAKQLGAQDIMPNEAFYRFFLGLDEEEIRFIERVREQNIDEERKVMKEAENEPQGENPREPEEPEQRPQDNQQDIFDGYERSGP